MDHAIAMATWPQRRLGEALFTLAEHAGISVSGSDRPQPPLDGDADALSSWIATAAGLGGFEARPVLVGLSDAATVAAHAPVLVRLRGLAGEPYLALIGKRGGKAIAIGPDGTRHRLGMAAIATLIRREFEAPIEAAVERNLDDMGMTADRRGRARAALLRERLAGVRFGGCWALRVSAGASVVAQARHAGVVPRLGLAVACHLLQYAMVLLAWWLLARGAFGSADPATWWGAGVLLAGLLPLRVLGTWVQGDAVVATGRILRRRLLHGALHVEPDEIRRRGEGVLFGTVLEAATVESVAIQNGLQTVFAALELTIAAGVLTFGASRPAIALLLVGWMAASCACAWRYAVRRREATRHRLHATNRLLESMLGHRTLKLHGEPERRTLDVARLLEEYAAAGDRMDGCGAWLSAVMPRGWLLIGVAAFAFEAPPTGPTVAAFAVTVAGVLLAFRACRRLATGLPGTIDAVIAWQCVASLTAAGPSTRRPATGCVNDPGSHATATVLEARDLTFRYPTSVVPVLQGCDLRVARGSNVLLEGPSGSGKTTLALVLAGLRQQESGAVLVDELDRSTVADWRWRRSVVMTPQIHDNHLISGSLAFNLLMGRRWPPTPADFADALTVCRELGLEALLDRLPGGLNQTVGETGWQLSQGERARVFLGRALLQRPDLIVLDEAFSALDPETVDRVLQSVQRRTPTVLAIAHT